MEKDLGSSGRRRLRPRRSSSPTPERDGDNNGPEGRIGALPDALLVLVLSLLGSTAEVARTSLVSPRWRSLWPDLPVLVFRGIGPDTLADLLAASRHSNLSRLEIEIPRQADPGIPASRISSLLRAADEHNPEEFVFNVGGSDDGDVPFDLPIFARATSIGLQIWNRGFVLPAAPGAFSALEKLVISLCCVEPGEFLPRCPRLRVLDVDCYWLEDDVDVHSDSLEELLLRDVPNRQTVHRMQRRVHIAAPRLRKFKLQSYGHAEMMAAFSAPVPMMEALSLRCCSIFSRSIGFQRQWRLMGLNTTVEWWGRDDGPVRVRVLSLVIVYHADHHAADRSIVEEILRLPVNNFSILKLELRSVGWLVFGEVVSDLLKTLNAIQRLELVLPQIMDHAAWRAPGRNLDHNPPRWAKQHILLPHLEELEIERLHVTDYDLDMVKLLFASAPELKTVRIQLVASVPQSDPAGYKDLCTVFWKYASAKCYVNGRLEEPEETPPPAPRRSNRLKLLHAKRHHHPA